MHHKGKKENIKFKTMKVWKEDLNNENKSYILLMIRHKNK